jgi:DUF4097 and DUF4098 domain-containing protein YvlB
MALSSVSRKFAVALASAVVLVLLVACVGPYTAGAKEQEEFHKSYSIAPNGSLKVKNINGEVKIAAWDGKDIEVNAVKEASSESRLREMEIRVYATGSRVEIETKEDSHWFDGGSSHISYEIKVPRSIRIEAESVNGQVLVTGAEADVAAKSVNGYVAATDVIGDLTLSTVNGAVEGSLRRLGHNVKLSTVNGAVKLRIPQDSDAEVDVHTVNGGVSNDFGLTVNRPQYGPGASIRATMGKGTSRIELNSVNGGVELRKF